MTKENLLTLFHYTCSQNLVHIKNDKLIRVGQLVSNKREHIRQGAVSLTTDGDSVGHGLPDGRRLTPSQSDRMKGRRYSVGSEIFCYDHTEFRLEIKISADDTDLIKASDYYANDPEIFEAMEITAYYPVDKSPLLKAKIDEAKSSFSSGKWIRKGPTWYFYRDDIPLEGIIITRWEPGQGYL